MDTFETNTEQLLLQDIERLRGQFPQTQELYREVCTLLFFRYGTTPTANKLYQYVKRGSMSAPAEALNRFWENLRKKSRVTIAHPDLPEDLRVAAGTLTATLWVAAQAQAQSSLAIFKIDAQSKVDAANVLADTAVHEKNLLQQAHETLQLELAEAQQQTSSVKQEVAVLFAANTSLESQLLDSKAEIAAHQQRFDSARREHVDELEKLRNATQLAEERFRSMEQRSLLEIDRERTATNKLQKTLDGERATVVATAERHRAELNALQARMGDLRQNIGVLEGTVQAYATARDQAIAQLQATQIQLDDASTQITLMRGETERLRADLQKASAALDERAIPNKNSGRGRKTKES